MVKLYALCIYYKSPTSINCLKTCYDLTSFSFFQRGSVQEFMTFVSKTLVERTQAAARQSVKQDEYTGHVYVRADCLAGVLLSDHDYPNRVSHTLLTKVLDEFAAKIPSGEWARGDETSIIFPDLPLFLSKYQNPREADSMTRIQEELDETKIILVKKKLFIHLI